MLDLPEHPILDKARLVGECVRLRIGVDAQRLKREVDALPAQIWGTPGGRVGVHRNAEAVFLRGYAPAEGDKPIEDRPALDQVPYVRYLIEQLVGAPRMRCLLARLPAATKIPVHVDRPPYFGKTLRLHVPVDTHASAFMLSGDCAYQMRAGELWVLNNSAPHGVINADPQRARTHLICDFLPDTRLLGLLREGDRGLGLGIHELARRLGESQALLAAAP